MATPSLWHCQAKPDQKRQKFVRPSRNTKSACKSRPYMSKQKSTTKLKDARQLNVRLRLASKNNLEKEEFLLAYFITSRYFFDSEPSIAEQTSNLTIG